MQTMVVYQLSENQIIPRETQTNLPVANSEGPIRLGAWEWATILVGVDVPAGTTLTLTVQLSPDGATWYDAYLHDLAAAANKWVLAANVAFVGAVQSATAEIGLSCCAPYVRLRAISAGADDAVLTSAWFVAIS